MTSERDTPSASIVPIVDLCKRLAEAQLRGDADALNTLLTDRFRLVGPAGFVLDKEQWIDQFRSGRLSVQSLTWDEAAVRTEADMAIVMAGRRIELHSRANQPAARSGLRRLQSSHRGEWRVIGLHLSPIVQAPSLNAR
jgi:hypothetical protein